jgi:hypothetical protein
MNEEEVEKRRDGRGGRRDEEMEMHSPPKREKVERSEENINKYM